MSYRFCVFSSSEWLVDCVGQAMLQQCVRTCLVASVGSVAVKWLVDCFFKKIFEEEGMFTNICK
jgi:hypothetical protein